MADESCFFWSYKMENENSVAVVPANGQTQSFDMDVFDTKTKANEGIEIEIMTPGGNSSGLFIRVLGADSDSYSKIKDRQDRARVRLLAKGGRQAIDSLYDNSKENDLELIVACTLGWHLASGQPLPFDIGQDTKQAVMFYNRYPQVQNQVRMGINDPANFTKASATQSSTMQRPSSNSTGS